MRTALGIALLGCLWLAGSARAGVPAVVDPFDIAGCGETDYVGAQMGDPNGLFAGVLDCPGLCRLAEAECKKLTKLTYSCQNLILGKRATWGKANCKETITDDPAALKDCKLAAKSQAATDKQGVKSAQQAATTACTQWSLTCQNTCDVP
jgi:hypothetical protein